MTIKKIRLIHRRVNFNSQSASRKKCEHSLGHSLRIAPPTSDVEVKKIEWDASLSGNNLIWMDGIIFRLNQFNEKTREQLVEKVAPPPKLANQSKTQTKLRQYRLKINKAIVSETNKGNHQAAQFLQQVLDSQEMISAEQIEQFESMDMQRKNQRVKMLETYAKVHNLLYDKVPANNVYVQEGIIKIPHRWNVGTDVISLQEYIDFTQRFLSEHFPQYEIKMIVGHDDERSADQKTGAHVHYFLGGRNLETGEYDLRKQQIAVVNQYIKNHRIPNVTLFPASGKLTRNQTKEFGRYFQRMLYDFANQHWLTPKGLIAEFAPETEKRSKRRQKMNEEAKLPKSQRSHNYYTHQILLARQELQREQARYDELHQESQHCSNEIDQLLIKQSEIALKNEELEVKTKTLRKQNAELEAKHASLSTMVKELTEQVSMAIQGVFKQLLLSLHAKDKGMRRKSLEYLSKALQKRDGLPRVFKQAMDSLTDEIELKQTSPRSNEQEL